MRIDESDSGASNLQTPTTPPSTPTEIQLTAQPPVDLGKVVEALTKLKRGSFIMIIAILLIAISQVFLLPLLLSAWLWLPHSLAPGLTEGMEIGFEKPPIIPSYGLIEGITLFIGAIFVLVAIFAGVIPGASALSKPYHQFRTGAKLIE